MKQLNGRKILITGGSWGIGRAIAVYLARQGCKVIITARREKLLQETISQVDEQGKKPTYYVADLGDEKQIKDLVSFVKTSFGNVDALINVAFGGLEESLIESSTEDLKEFINVSITGNMLVTKEILNLMGDQGDIINIVADWGLPMHNIMTEALTPYITAKHAMSGFSHTLRRELGTQGRDQIRVSAIYPGATAAVDIENDKSINLDDSNEVSEGLISLEDIARSVAFMLSLDNGFITHLVLSPPSNLYNGIIE